MSLAEARTAATVTLLTVGLWILNLMARPITPGRAVLFGSMVGIFAVILAVPALRDFFALELLSGAALWGSIVVGGRGRAGTRGRVADPPMAAAARRARTARLASSHDAHAVSVT